MKRLFAMMLGVLVLGSSTTSAGLFDFLKPQPLERTKFVKPDGPPVLRQVVGEVVPGTPVEIVVQKVGTAGPTIANAQDEPAIDLGKPTTMLTVSAQLQVPPGPEGGPALTSEGAVLEAEPVPAAVQVIELFPCVTYEDYGHIHPCAVRTVVAVKDPTCCPDPCGCCQPGCVYVEICVPPCGPYKYEIKRRDHSKIEYDYGRYEVEITSRNGVVHVDYDH
jgi:hypothetical protein